MTTVMPVMLGRRHTRPSDTVLRQPLYGWAYNPPRRAQDVPVDVREALTWLSTASVPVSALRQLDMVRRVLDALAVRLDGRPAPATTIYRKRAVFYNALGYAVERGLLPGNPIEQVHGRLRKLQKLLIGASWLMWTRFVGCWPASG